jgi:hypothetical protein
LILKIKKTVTLKDIWQVQGFEQEGWTYGKKVRLNYKEMERYNQPG